MSKQRKRDANLDMLIGKLENMQQGLGGNECKPQELVEMDKFTSLKKAVAKKVHEIRNLIKERDQCLEATSGNGNKHTVILSCNIREKMREASDLHKKMQVALAEEQAALSRGQVKGNSSADIEAHIETVELVSKHIIECQLLERNRYKTNGRSSSAIGFGGGRGGANETRRLVETSADLDDIDPEVAEGLRQLSDNDAVLDKEQESLSRGVTNLQRLAQQQSAEVGVQGVLLDDISAAVDGAHGSLHRVNRRVADTVRRV